MWVVKVCPSGSVNEWLGKKLKMEEETQQQTQTGNMTHMRDKSERSLQIFFQFPFFSLVSVFSVRDSLLWVRRWKNACLSLTHTHTHHTHTHKHTHTQRHTNTHTHRDTPVIIYSFSSWLGGAERENNDPRLLPTDHFKNTNLPTTVLSHFGSAENL